MAKLDKIVFHWSAGGYKPNATDIEHYHYLVDDKGEVYNGKFKPEDNENCQDGKYAAHTGYGNTGAIGIALCGMAGFSNRQRVGKYPLTKTQVEASFSLAAKLCKKYKLNPLADEVIQTHYGFGKRHPKTSSAGKIDIVYLPPYPEVQQDKIENFIRSKVNWYLSKL